ncbi:mechanosensitive ion channel family protein [Dolichospermum flos-aquae]|uniref:Mechanosensitive ion channel family protein n=1 Tax=Dolichospermum flos-aquae LEGE 04289 TaxID=1828708 RepID=A0ACC5PZ87_DOLFA|nr:mechanosensitive ion channel family protein [Dolichospermum flos-aquae]MBE9218166.1 mechanosensitive ion channel family protein [Dolichospermum flos-aquae LEGE 04289]
MILRFLAIAGTMAITIGSVNKATAQISPLPLVSTASIFIPRVDEKEYTKRANPLILVNKNSDGLQYNPKEANQEQQTRFLVQQGGIAAVSTLAIIAISWGMGRWQKRLSKNENKSIPPISTDTQPITTLLNQKQQQHLQEVRTRLFQTAQVMLWGGGTLIILGLFPYTKPLQIAILAIAQIPIKLTIVAVGTYVAIRFTYALIDHFTSTIVSGGALLTPETSARLQLRISTFSGVTKSITTIIWVGAGSLLALTSLGINIVPLLASAGLLGVALSLPSQNLIKDAINGFLIIFEDQYALGDMITVGTVGGLVEKLNLRMTQVRDSEGRLITIPNSEVKIVANLSSRWSRADLTIPVSYQANVDEALKLIEDVGLDMTQDPQWQDQILEKPNVLGIDNFSDRGIMIRILIKTQPLKQWAVAREYRRRLKITLDAAGIYIPVPQQANWVNEV